MLGGSLLLRREMLDELGGYDAGFRMYGEEIDLCYRAAKAGWERWYVPGAVVTHRWDALTDKRFLTRRTLWHWRSILRYHARKHPEPKRVAARRCDLDRPRVRRPGPVPAAPRRARARARPEARARRPAVDLACGDGGLADFLPGIDYLGVDADPRMVEEARSKGRAIVACRPERVRARRAGRGDDHLPRDLLRTRPPRVPAPRGRLHGAEGRLRPESTAVPRSRT